MMRLKHRDKQQQRYQHGMGMSMALTVTYSQALTSHYYPVPHTQMQAPHQQMQQTFTYVTQEHSQQHFQQTLTQPHAPAQHNSRSMDMLSVGIERDLPYRYWERYTGVLSINIENYRINKTMLKSQLTLYSVSIFPQ